MLRQGRLKSVPGPPRFSPDAYEAGDMQAIKEFANRLDGRPAGSVQNLSHRRLAERHPALAHAVMAPLICWSFSNSMFRYLLVDHAVPAMWRSLAAARLSAD